MAVYMDPDSIISEIFSCQSFEKVVFASGEQDVSVNQEELKR